MRINPLDHLAVKLEYEPQHAVCRGVLGPEVDRKVAQRGVLRGHAVASRTTRPSHVTIKRA